MKKVFKRGLAAMLSAALVLTLLPDIHDDVNTVHAAENSISTQFYATPEQLLDSSIFALHPDYGGQPKSVRFGWSFGGPQSWYIAGKDPSTGGLVLVQGMYFEKQIFEDTDKSVYSSSGLKSGYNIAEEDGKYVGRVSYVAASHYGTSDIRQFLKATETNPNRFSVSEQALMQTTTIYTWDLYNNKAYSTNDKLYLANAASNGGSSEGYITVGTNTLEDLYGGLKIEIAYWGPYSSQDSLGNFWLREPADMSKLGPWWPKYKAVFAANPGSSGCSYDGVGNKNTYVVPVFSLDLSTVLFASAAPVASSYLSGKIWDISLAAPFQLRYDGSGKLDATALCNASDITVTAPAGSGLVVQYNDGSDKCYTQYFSEAVTNETILASDIAEGLNLENCKIWIEQTTEDRITYAVQAQSHTHTPSGELLSDAEHHYYLCSTCGGKGDAHAHDWIIDKETSEGEAQYRICSVCGYMENHTHAFSLLHKNATGHWYECECGEVDMDIHSFGNWISVQGRVCEEIYYFRNCTICGYGYYSHRTLNHRPSTEYTAPASRWRKDATGHWLYCLDCGESLGLEAHDYSKYTIVREPTETTTGAKMRYCQTCSYREYVIIPKLEENHEHNFLSVWKTNETVHWKECECGDKIDTEPHTFGDWITNKAGDGNEAGEKYRICSVCGYIEIHTHSVAWNIDGTGHQSWCALCGDKLSDSASHVYGDWIIDKEAAEGVAGLKHRYCNVCGYNHSISMPPLGVLHNHSYSGWSGNATSHWHECSYCGQKSDVDVHSFGSWVIDKEATENAAGLQHRTCGECGYTENAVIPKTSHTHSFGSEYDMNETSHWLTCVCGEKTGVAAHSFGDWIIDKEASESEDGKQHRICSECGYTEIHTHTFSTGYFWGTDGISHWHECSVCGAKKDVGVHSFGDWIIVQEATEQQMGYKERICSVCSYHYAVYIPKLGEDHTHSFTKWYGDETSHWRMCQCGEISDMALHSFGTWIIDREATESEDGRKHRTCSECGYDEYVVIPKGETSHTHSFSSEWGTNETGHWRVCECGEKTDTEFHSFGDWIIDKETTENEAGARHRTCSVCGYTETHIHEFTSGWKWKHDDTNHWLQCRYCDEKLYIAAHSYGDWRIDKEATESETGRKSRRCSICQWAEYVTIPILGETHTHVFSLGWSRNETSHWHECGCGETSETAVHSYGDWIIDREATESENGERHRICGVCGYTETGSIPKTEGHTHGFSADWSINDTSHWHECECGEKADVEAHSFGEWMIDKEATETEAGTRHRTCGVCGYEETGTIPATEGHTHNFASDWNTNETSHWHECECGEKAGTVFHNFGEWVIDKEATESEAGEKSRSCGTCGYTETVTIPADGEDHVHSYASDWSRNETSHWHVCDCGEKADTTSHDFSEWVIVREASESEAGERSRNCSICGYTETGTIPKKEPHVHSFLPDWGTNETNHWHQCSVCGEKADMAVHSYGEWVIDKEASESETGAMHRDCGICGYTETRIIPKAGAHVHSIPSEWSVNDTSHWQQCSTCGEKVIIAVHSFGNWITDKEASESEDGVRHRTCDTCGYIEERTIPKVGEHDHSFEGWIIDKQATESETGEQHRVCSLCGYTENGIIPKVPISHTHSFGDWIVDKEASESETGAQHRICSACGYIEYGIIPKLETVHIHNFLPEWSQDKIEHWHECECGEKADMAAHSFGGWIIDREATESESGSKHRTCSVCGYTENRVIPKTGSDDAGTGAAIGGEDAGSVGNPDDGDGSETIPQVESTDMAGNGNGSDSTDNPDNMPEVEEDMEVKKSDNVHVKIYVTMTMIAGVSYLMSMLFGRRKTAGSKKKNHEEKQDEYISDFE